MYNARIAEPRFQSLQNAKTLIRQSRRGTGGLTMRDFEKDRRTIQDRKDGYVTDEVFLKYAENGWPAALQEIKHMSASCKLAGDAIKGLLDEIESLKRQLEAAGVFAASQPYCPDGKDCDGYSTSEQSCTACWLEHWRQKAGDGAK